MVGEKFFQIRIKMLYKSVAVAAVWIGQGKNLWNLGLLYRLKPQMLNNRHNADLLVSLVKMTALALFFCSPLHYNIHFRAVMICFLPSQSLKVQSWVYRSMGVTDVLWPSMQAAQKVHIGLSWNSLLNTEVETAWIHSSSLESEWQVASVLLER